MEVSGAGPGSDLCSPPVIYRFAEFELDLARVELRARGAVARWNPRSSRCSPCSSRTATAWSRGTRSSRRSGTAGSSRTRRSRAASSRRARRSATTASRSASSAPCMARAFASSRDVRAVQGGATVAAVAGTLGGRRRARGRPALSKLAKPSIAVLPFRLVGDAGPYARDRRGAARRADHRPRAPALAVRDGARLLVPPARRGRGHGRDRPAARRALLSSRARSRSAAAPRRLGRARRHARRRHRLGGTLRRRAGRRPPRPRRDPTERARRARDADPAARGGARAAQRERGPRRLVRLPPRPAAHVPLQPPGQRRRDRRCSSARSTAIRLSRARTRACRSSTSRPRSCATPTTSRARCDLARRFAARGGRARRDGSVRELRDGPHATGSLGDLDGALPWLERATALSPSYAQGIYARAWTETLAGQALEDGRGHVDLAMRLSPLDPLHYGMLGTRAFSHLMLGEDARRRALGGARGACAGRARPDRDDRVRGARARGRRGGVGRPGPRACASAMPRSGARISSGRSRSRSGVRSPRRGVWRGAGAPRRSRLFARLDQPGRRGLPRVQVEARARGQHVHDEPEDADRLALGHAVDRREAHLRGVDDGDAARALDLERLVRPDEGGRVLVEPEARRRTGCRRAP